MDNTTTPAGLAANDTAVVPAGPASDHHISPIVTIWDMETPLTLLVDTADAARILCMSEAMVHKLRRNGHLPSVKVGKLRRYRIADLEAIAIDGIDA